MSEIVVVYELDKPVTVHNSGGLSRGDGRPVHRVHAAPAAPGMTSVPGPRTFCGKDTFAMETASWKPSENPGSSWYTPKYARQVCTACDDVVGNG
ncbi:hypothetical protein [Streptomyces sp. GS7]|uniref:hypothetical protein n=1 Tax=Streptomyces sp. GS7 TaxID=2692234 RepID=UPI0013161EB1|nr:hypothetical protein [Streptomyces sp. GS7]QHC21420.1 hypothetical protein GR130_08250 [Streptomyces sp. GS7]